jgi:predicted outer membrane lipoprotein
MDVVINFGSQQPSWTQVLAALGVPVALAIAIGNALWQSRLQRRHLKQAMFEKRLTVYMTVREFMRSVIEMFRVEFPALIRFGRETHQAVFLFERPVQDFIQEISQKANELYQLNERLGSNPSGDQNRLNEKHQLQEWFVEAHQTRLAQVFTESLRLYDQTGRFGSAWRSTKQAIRKRFRK